MAGVTIPSTLQQAATNKANIESRLNQTTPAAPQAFNNVIAGMEAMQFTSLYKYGADRFQAGLWISAQGSDLDYLGQEYGLPRNQASNAIITATMPATDGTVIPILTVFTSSANGLQYQTTAEVTAPFPGGSGTGVTLTLVCLSAGTSGNLSNGSLLAIQTPIAGASGVGTVASTVTTATDDESDDDYRNRGLAIVQTLPNGSNASSYRLWGLSVPGVVQIYPYSGAPLGSGITSYPGMRTIYVECDTSIEPDGIAPGTWDGTVPAGTGLVGQVADAIITDPVTGLAREDLGLVISQLYVQPITRTPIFVVITGLNVPSGATASAQADIQTALTNFLLTISPFVSGVDPTFNRNDTFSQTLAASVVQSVLTGYGAFVQGISFGLTSTLFLPSYQVGQGEKLKLSAPVIFL
jgi:hypothetical protein